MKGKKFMAMFLAAAMACTVMGCSSGGGTDSSDSAPAAKTDTDTDKAETEKTEANGQFIEANVDARNTEVTDETIRIVLASEPSTLWGAPAGKIENESVYIADAIMSRLVAVDENGEVIPALATEWEWVDDTHCRFTLRDDVVLTNGQTMTADDVVYTVGIWREYSANTDTGQFIMGAEAEDDSTVVIEFTQKAPDLLAMLAWGNFGIVSQAEVEAAGGLEAVQSNPVIGCGKYRFVEWKSGESIILERNENYWDKDFKGYYKRIECTFTNDAAARKLAVDSGDAQVAVDMPVIQAVTYTEDEKIDVVIYDFGQVTHLWFNMTEGKATADKNIREAIMKSIDYEALAMVGTGGTAEQALGFASPSSYYFNETYTKEERKPDVEGAKALLAEAGYANGIDLTILGTADLIPMYTVIQENCRAAGINLTLNTPDTASFISDAFSGNYDMITIGWIMDNRNPSIITSLDKGTIEAGFAIGGPKVTTDEIDTLRKDIIAAEDPQIAKEKLAELENIMKSDCIQANLYPEMKAAIVTKGLKGYNTLERGFTCITDFYK
ncbi:ABC transporter substrate-binding protein [Blautia hominis]|uniref:ABC transporter substrate-binding protein n=1 Tax=Blautia hominis TaxID=2025493 RepID=A0ABQ0BKR8_9FIRM